MDNMDDTKLKTADDVSHVFTGGGDDTVQPFQLDSSSLRGRAVRLGPMLDEILSAHDYPNPIAHLVAEAMVAALLLSSMLKYKGIFTLQTSGDGPVKMLVADVTSDGKVRACASYDPERLQHAREQLSALKATESSENHLAQYLGKGHIALTVDQGPDIERYQALVELKGSSMTDCVQHYFQQSKQMGSGIKMSVGQRDGQWRAGAIMLQKTDEDDAYSEAGTGNINEDDWRRAMILLDTCTDGELLAPILHSNELLLRLFHEEGVRVYDPVSIEKSCRCDADKVEAILRGMTDEELEYMADEGGISMRCEFCSHDYVFALSDIQSKIN